MRVCSVPGCPKRTPCPDHTLTTTQRGLGHDYRKVRDPIVKAATYCANCGDPFTEDNPATGGHRVPRRDGGTLASGIVAHCARCNYGWQRTGL